MGQRARQNRATVPTKPSFWMRWGWRLSLSAVILAALGIYYAYQRGAFLTLPELGDLEAFRKNQSPARALCRKLNLPELPDISGIDPEGQKQFHTMFSRLRAKPRDADEYGLLGQLYDAQKFPDLAARLYHRAIEMDPGDHQWHYQLALHLESQGQTQEADQELRRASELEPDYAPVWMRRAWRAAEAGDAGAALSFVDRYIRLRPQDPLGYVQKAQIHTDQDDYQAAFNNLKQAEQLGTLGKQGHRLLATLYRHEGKEDESSFQLQMAATERGDREMDDPIGIMVRRLQTFRNPVQTRFSGLVDAGRYQEALALVDQVMAESKDSPDYGQICGKISEAYRQVGDYRNAYIYADKARQAIPTQAQPYVQLALILVNTGNFQAALEAADQALAIDRELDVALYARGLTQMQIAVRARNAPAVLPNENPQARLEAAVGDLEKCVEKKPVNLSYLVALASAHGMLEHFEVASQLLDTALRISPGDENTRLLKSKADARLSFWPASRPS